MNKGIVILITGLFFMGLVAVPLHALAPLAKATFVAGKVTAVASGKTRMIKSGAPLYKGDRVAVGSDGKIELRFSDNSIVRLAANSSMLMDQGKDLQGRNQAKTDLRKGKNWVRASKPSDKWGGLQAKTPLAVASIKGTVYRQSVAVDTTTKISVYQGEVEVAANPAEAKPGAIEELPHPIGEPEEISMEKWLEVVKELQQITITPDGKHTVEDIPESDAVDPWVKWNEEMDKKLEKAE